MMPRFSFLLFSSLSFGLVRFIYRIFDPESQRNEKSVPKVGPDQYARMLYEDQKNALIKGNQ